MNKILCLGAINKDYVYRVTHLVTPGETLMTQTMAEYPGGKGFNQAVAIGKSGGNVFLGGKIGPEGTQLLNYAATCRVNVDQVITVEGITGHAIIQVDAKGQNCILLYPGVNQEQVLSEVEKMFETLDYNDIVVLQNEINDVDQIIERAHQRQLKIAFNPSPCTESISNYPIDKVKWLILNEGEAMLLTRISDADKAFEQLVERYPDTEIVMTLGSKGVIYGQGSRIIKKPAIEVVAIDTTAAGDTFLGYFVSAVSKGLEVEEALELAVTAAAMAVTKNGASSSIPELEEVLHFKRIESTK